VPRRYEAATVGASKCRDMKAQWFGKKNDDLEFPKMDGFGFPVTILASKNGHVFFFLCF